MRSEAANRRVPPYHLHRVRGDLLSPPRKEPSQDGARRQRSGEASDGARNAAGNQRQDAKAHPCASPGQHQRNHAGDHTNLEPNITGAARRSPQRLQCLPRKRPHVSIRERSKDEDQQYQTRDLPPARPFGVDSVEFGAEADRAAAVRTPARQGRYLLPAIFTGNERHVSELLRASWVMVIRAFAS